MFVSAVQKNSRNNKKNKFKIWMTRKYENMLVTAQAWLT